MAAHNERVLSEPPADATVDQLEQLLEMPPSAKLVYYVLDRADDPLSSTDIAERTLLPKRTARNALNELQTIDVVRMRPALMDARKWRYELVDSAST
jgi:DNA-binding MarR family transcriptional regulator